MSHDENDAGEIPTPAETALNNVLAEALIAARQTEPLPAPSVELRERIEARLMELESQFQEKPMKEPISTRRGRRRLFLMGFAATAAATAGVMLLWPETARNVANLPKSGITAKTETNFLHETYENDNDSSTALPVTTQPEGNKTRESEGEQLRYRTLDGKNKDSLYTSPDPKGASAGDSTTSLASNPTASTTARPADSRLYDPTSQPTDRLLESAAREKASPQVDTAPTDASITTGGNGSPSQAGPGYPPQSGAGGIPAGGAQGIPGGVPHGFQGGGPGMPGAGSGTGVGGGGGFGGYPGGPKGRLAKEAMPAQDRYYYERGGREKLLAEVDEAERTEHHFALGHTGSEQYDAIVENAFASPVQAPLSTFSIDVDTASYSNTRRFLTQGQIPPANAVRIEELVNYFSYSYPQPQKEVPFSVNMESAECPWQPGHLLVRVGLKGKEIARKERPASNLVFLLDVSGSMADENKLPLLKSVLAMLVSELTENDRVSIVTYAGEAGLRLGPTSGDQKEKILGVINGLQSGGSTNGSAGIEIAYQQATEGFLKNGTNRVILATDGDLNVGVTDDESLVKLIKTKAEGGTFLTCLGFGEGNLKDGKMEKIADNGNGIYAYIDTAREGHKVLVEQMSGSLITIAKDVKIQIEFNPAQVQSYRLLGYENRVLAAADFANDKKDAGEIGAGHTVTALYEIVPVGAAAKAGEGKEPAAEPLRYQKSAGSPAPAAESLPKDLTEAAATGEILTLKLRYKEPMGDTSKLLEFPLKERGGQFNSASQDFQFAAAVASFGMILRGSEHRGSGNLSAVAEIAAGAIGNDPSGLRAEFVDLVRRAEKIGVK